MDQQRAELGLQPIANHALTLVGGSAREGYRLRNPWGHGDPAPLTPAHFKRYLAEIDVCPR